MVNFKGSSVLIFSFALGGGRKNQCSRVKLQVVMRVCILIVEVSLVKIVQMLKVTSIGCTSKALAASSSEKINIDFVCEIVNFGSPNLIILKKRKSKSTTKYHNILTISSFLGSE